MSFTQLGLPAPIVEGVRAAGYSQPTPVQQRAIPVILTGRDLVGASQTGSGKTAAFLLPILARLMRGPQAHRALRALVLVPTRELAAQVEASAREYARFTELRSGAVFGGLPIGPQERMLRHQGVDLLVATPGRLLDLHGRQSVAFEDVEVVVLDEADRMVDMGFAPDLRRILRLLPRTRQTLMFSATMPGELNRVAEEALHHPMRVDLGERSRPAPTIAQAFYPVARHRKVDLLSHVLRLDSTEKAIVFVRSKRGADRLVRRLRELGHPTAALHGDRSQGQREQALLDFRRGRVPFLVATDIASRGIDVDDVTHVINYDVPLSPEDYVHRIGRTGRMHAAGEAVTLMSPEERSSIRDIERFLGREVKPSALPDFAAGRSFVAAPPGRRVRGTGPSQSPDRRESERALFRGTRVTTPGLAPRGISLGPGRDSALGLGHGVASHGRRRRRVTGDRGRRRR